MHRLIMFTYNDPVVKIWICRAPVSYLLRLSAGHLRGNSSRPSSCSPAPTAELCSKRSPSCAANTVGAVFLERPRRSPSRSRARRRQRRFLGQSLTRAALPRLAAHASSARSPECQPGSRQVPSCPPESRRAAPACIRRCLPSGPAGRHRLPRHTRIAAPTGRASASGHTRPSTRPSVWKSPPPTGSAPPCPEAPPAPPGSRPSRYRARLCQLLNRSR